MNWEYVTPLEFERLRHNEEVCCLDVREPEEWEIGNLGGIHIPLSYLREKVDELNPQRTYILVCRSGRRSEAAYFFLKQKGFQSVKILKGGLLAWKETTKANIEIL